MFPSVRSFLALSYTLVVVLILLVLGLRTQALVEKRLRQEVDAEVQARAAEVSRFLTSDTDIDLTEQATRGIIASSGDSGATHLRLYNPDGVPAVLPGSLPPIPEADARELKSVRDQAIRTVQGRDGRQFRLVTRRVMYGEQTIAYLQVASALAPVNRTATQLRHTLLYGGILAGIVAGVLSYLLAYQALKPFSSIVEDARQIGAEDLDRRLPTSYGVGEVSRLAQSFNSLLDRLQKVFDLQRRFVADASHELRTPLTSIRGNVDVLLLDPELPPATREALQNVSAESARLSRLITNLLLLARADAGQSEPPARPVDLHGLVLETVRQARLMSSTVDLRLVREDQASVMGDADQLKQVLLNLLDNALKYTPDGGWVRVSVYREGTWAKLEVQDNGIGIAPSDLARIFDRFYRAERSPHGISGSGLGLSIVQWVVHAHSGRITVESKLGEGSIFTVWLPSASALAS